MLIRLAIVLISIVSAGNATTTSHTSKYPTTTSQATGNPSSSSSIRSPVTSTISSVLSRPTYFQVVARNSGTKYDGRHLLGTDQSLSNITFGSLPSDVYPSSKLYLAGTNKNPRLSAIDGEQLWGGYNCGDQQLCPYDGSAAFLVFGGADFVLYEYSEVLCSAVQKKDGKFYLACSVEASDKKVKYRKAIVDHSDGHVLLLPAGGALPSGFSFVDMEVQMLKGSAPTTLPPCCPR